MLKLFGRIGHLLDLIMFDELVYVVAYEKYSIYIQLYEMSTCMKIHKI